MQQTDAPDHSFDFQQQWQNAKKLLWISHSEANCVGCIDGMLLWIEQPFPKECEKVGVDGGKFYCSWKAKFSLNLQGVCDACRRFTYISVQHPASTSDYLSTSLLYQQLMEGSGLPNSYCLYGDNT